METQLIYLHIEKTAGSSMRNLFFDNYGSDGVFWYLVDSKSPTFKQEELSEQRVIGGHRDKKFYDSLWKSKLYLSVIREPISRVISLFNYHGKINPAKEVWYKRGLEPECLDKTLSNCPEFIDEITNRQCQIISGYRSAEKTLAAIEKEPYIIGTMEHLSSFVSHVSDMFDWPFNSIKKINSGGEFYTKSVAVSESALRLIRSLNEEDQKLYDYVKNRILVDTLDDSTRGVFSHQLAVRKALSRTEFTKADVTNVSCGLIGAKVDISSLEICISIKNNSQVVLPQNGNNAIWIGIKVGKKEYRRNLDSNVFPGTSISQTITLPKPEYSCEVQISLIKRNEYWFSEVNPKHLINYDLEVIN